ncbi:hypothetical protein PV10_01900 [Exophiala mesophila]|uniref:Uncharacterized protein n=1 Tax=Exophiala mesophila TaxID=212818 RepID=A0A0D1ZUM7_EXOME|nr:uncharacterized protein PV10_01900 [Exophiala mesophila]KIV98232.1 hypothetical protein PV10_01900 [Exophiala mesophila]
MSSTQAQIHLRSLYRRIMRELPPRTLASTKTTAKSSSRSPLHASIRSHLADSSALSPSSTHSTPPAAADAGVGSSAEHALARRQELEQLVQYLRAQRLYGVLLERYNPGTGMDEEERVRLTARRVGMDLPVEYEWKPPR